MKKKNKWGKHKKKYIRKYCGFPELCLLSYDGLGDYHRVTDEEKQLWQKMKEEYNPKDDNHSILGYMKKYDYSWDFVYRIVHGEQV